MARIAVSVLFSIVVLGIFAAPAPAVRQMRHLEPNDFEADDSRYAVFSETWGLRIVDTVQHQSTAFEYSRIPTYGENDSSCSLGDAHAGYAVLNCYTEEYGNPRPWVVNLSTLDVVTPPGSPPIGKYSQPFEYYWVGIHWVAVFDGDAEAWVFWNWRTGEFRFLDGWAKRPLRDLDTAQLLARPRGLAASEGRTRVWDRYGRLELWHRTRHVLLALCPCSGEIALSAGRVAWTHGKFLTSYRIRDGWRIRWRLPASERGYPEPLLFHTRNRLYVFNWYDESGYAARWPPA